MTFWNAAAQHGFKPKAVFVGKATEFAAAVTPSGKRGENLSIGAPWSPVLFDVPGLTGITSRKMADPYEEAAGKQWPITVGLQLSFFGAAFEALEIAKDPYDREAIRHAIHTMRCCSIFGLVDLNTGPYANTVQMPLAISQWRKGTRLPLELLVADKPAARDIPLQFHSPPIG